MKIIAFEGLDKSGKNTQSNLLVESLYNNSYKVVKSEFHRYDTPTGKLIQDYLYGRYKANDETIELLMLADKMAQQTYFEGLENQGVDFLILDRYTGSQYAYGVSKGLSPSYMNGLLSQLKYQPDLEIFLDVAPTTSMSRKGKHGDNDLYESDMRLLTNVRKAYLSMYNESNRAVVLPNIDSMSSSALGHWVYEEVAKRFLRG